MTIRLLVVGGNGFIGRHVVARALRMGWAVTGLGLTSNDFPSTHCVTADVSDAKALRQVLGDGRFDYVVNCGGYIDHSLFGRGGRKLLESHFEGLLNLVEVLDRNTLQSFINLGSSDEYGNALAPQNETLREAPISPYSLAKTAATHFLQTMHRTEGLPAVTLRLFLTYGPGQSESRFLPQIIRGCLEGREFPASAGEQLRDFCFIEDTVRAVFAAMEAPKACGEVINVASGEPVSVRAMIDTVCRIVGRGHPRFGDLPYRPMENMALFADISKAQLLLGWAPMVSLDEGLKHTIAWMKAKQ